MEEHIFNEKHRGQKRRHSINDFDEIVEKRKPTLFQRFKQTAMKVFGPFLCDQPSSYSQWDWASNWGSDRWFSGSGFDRWREPSKGASINPTKKGTEHVYLFYIYKAIIFYFSDLRNPPTLIFPKLE